MTPLPRKTMTLLAGLLVALSSGLTGCQDRDIGLTIQQIQPIDPETCQVNNDETTFSGAGSVDIALRDNYRIAARVKNNLTSINEVKALAVTDGRLDTNSIVLRTATIEYTTLSTLSAEIQSPVVVPLSVTVDVGGTSTLFVDVLNSATLNQLREADEFLVISNGQVNVSSTTIQLIARIRIQGETLDGKTVESNEFLYPITVCAGCGVIFEYNSNGEKFCPSFPNEEGGVPLASTSCLDDVGADGTSIDCRLCPRFVPEDSPYRQVCQP